MSNAARALALLCALILAGAAPLGFSTARAPYAFSFPRDHYAHDTYRTEWWYFTGHLRTDGGRTFGYELTFFRVGLEPRASSWPAGTSRWRAYQLYPAHFAISDIGGKTFVHDETVGRDALGDGFASERSLDVRANGWRLTGTPETLTRMHISASHGGDALDLHMQSKKPPAIHGSGGISRKGPCASCASHYYSFTRLATAGTLTRAGVHFRVTGVSWMDHEFGSDELQSNQSGWDWFSLQLDDWREIMLYRLRQNDGTTTPESSGSIVDRRGGVTHLALAGFSIAQTGAWLSPHTGATYPSGWRVRVGATTYVLVPQLVDQELPDPGGTTYWEGAVDVRDATSGASVGMGYVELTGYASAVRL